MTTETQKNPTAVLMPNPTSLDLALEHMQTVMAAKINWLEKVFGRARMMQRDVGGQKRIEPMVYQGGSEYYSVLPNDALKAFSFFQLLGGRNLNEIVQNINPMEFQSPVALIVWGNLNKVDSSKDYIFTEELINQVATILNSAAYCPGVGLGKIFDDKIDDIYKGFTVFPEQRDMLLYPFFAFRIEFELTYYINCP